MAQAARSALRGALHTALLLALLGCGEPPPVDEAPEPDLREEGLLSRSIFLYFADSDGERLVGERRELTSESPAREDFARLLIGALAEGPVGEDLHPSVPAGLKVEGVFFDDMGGFYVTMDGASLSGWPWGSSSEILFVRSMICTIAGSFPEVRRITFLVDGGRVESIAGHVETLHPFEVSEWR